MPPKRRRTASNPPDSEPDVVEIRFIQDPAASFRYFRDSLVARAPNSIFAHHFGPDGLNAGKTLLPKTYTVDRDPELFAVFVDPWLRGYSVPSASDWTGLSERAKEILKADATFYGLPDEFFPDEWDRARVPGRTVLSFREAAEIEDFLSKAIRSESRTPLPGFFIRSKVTHVFEMTAEWKVDTQPRKGWARVTEKELRKRLDKVPDFCEPSGVSGQDQSESRF